MKKVSLFALVVFLASIIGHKIYISNLDFMHFTKCQALTEWIIRVIRDISLGVIISIGIISSISNYAIVKNRLLAKLWIALSVTSCLMLSVMPYFISIELEKHLSILSEPDPLENPIKMKDYEKRILSKKSLSEKISLSKNIASTVYVKSGKAINVVDKNNQLTPYIPSQNDIKRHNEFVHTKKMMKHTISSLKKAIFVWAFVLFISIAIGLILYKRNRAKLTSFK